MTTGISVTLRIGFDAAWLVDPYDADFDNCHKTVEEMYGISFRAPFGTQAFPRPISQGPMW